MTSPIADGEYEPLPEGFDPSSVLNNLVFTEEEVDPAELPPPPGPLDKVTARSTVTIHWDYRTRLRIEAIADERGVSVADILEELAEVEVARLDALEAMHNRQGGAGQHHAA